MPLYNSTYDLPINVTRILSYDRQEQWLGAYKACILAGDNEEDAYTKAWQVVLADAWGVSAIADMPPLRFALPKDPKLESCIMDVYNSEDMKSKYPDAKERKSHAIAICRAQLGLSEHYSFIVDLRTVKLSESTDELVWMQAIPLGDYYHPDYGEIVITQEKVQEFADNINNNIRGQELDIDYEHKENFAEGGRAAGWIKRAESRDDGLWIAVSFTDRARTAIEDGEYRYFSPEYSDVWVHPKTQVTYHNVMFGGGLTNRPFLKDILPINLSEYIPKKKQKEPPQKEVKMDELLTKLRELLGLEANADAKADAEAISGAVETALSEKKKLSEGITALAKTAVLNETEPAKVFSAVSDIIKAHVEANKDAEKARRFAEDYPEEAQRLAELSRKTKEGEVALKMTSWTKEGKAGVLPAKLQEPVKKFRESLDGDMAKSFDEVMDSIVATGLAPAKEIGRGDEIQLEDSDAEFLTRVRKYTEEKKVDTRTAMAEVAREHPELARAWRDRRPAVASEGGE